MRTLSEILIARLFNNPLGRAWFGVPKNKQIYKITKSSAHYYTGELSKTNGMPVICTGDTRPDGRNPFVYWLETWKPIHLCWFYERMGWKIPKYFIGLDTGAKAPTTTGEVYNQWLNPTNAYATDESFTTKSGDEASQFRQNYKTFGFGVTAGATINGVEVVVKAKASAADTLTIEVYDGTTNLSKTQALTTTNTAYTLGGAADLWTGSWVAGDFSDANFRMQIVTSDVTLNTFSVDSITVKVYYTEAAAATGNFFALF